MRAKHGNKEEPEYEENFSGPVQWTDLVDCCEGAVLVFSVVRNGLISATILSGGKVPCQHGHTCPHCPHPPHPHFSPLLSANELESLKTVETEFFKTITSPS